MIFFLHGSSRFWSEAGFSSYSIILDSFLAMQETNNHFLGIQ